MEIEMFEKIYSLSTEFDVVGSGGEATQVAVFIF